MNYSSSTPSSLPAPCIIDQGTLVHKEDIRRILSDLGQVHYIHLQDDCVIQEGDGYVLEVFADSIQATLVANHALYLNVHSFDYLELGRPQDQTCYFDLVQDNRRLRLIPLSNPLQGGRCSQPQFRRSGSHDDRCAVGQLGCSTG